MIAIEIIMLIIGIAAVIASFRLSDEKETDNTKSNIDAEELEEKIKDAVKETEDYIITKADEKFSQISNDKIMGFNEYSKEVFDKIEKNHEETVFLYNMLTEKEKEIQKLVHSVDTTNAGLRDEAAKTYQEVKKQLSDVDSAIRQIEVENVRNTGEDEKSNEAFSSVLDDDEAKAIAEITETSDGGDSEEENTYYDGNKRNDNSSNSNSEIIALYKKGISILEISKMLSIGQGEVKLVVDLYNAR